LATSLSRIRTFFLRLVEEVVNAMSSGLLETELMPALR
jgi:hypothetical protein